MIVFQWVFLVFMVVYGLWAMCVESPYYAIAAGLFAIAMRM